MTQLEWYEIKHQIKRLHESSNALARVVGHHPVPYFGDNMDPLAGLTAQVTATVGVEQSAITLIQGLAAALTAAAGDPAKIAAIVTQLNASAAALSAAVAANPSP